MDNIPKPPSFEQYINKITTKVGYLDKYGGSVIVTMITLFVFFLLFSYLYIIARLKPIKNDWENQRCNPEVMPFAGFINKKPGQSAFDFTSENFTYCTEMILNKIVGYFTLPVQYSVSTLTKFYSELLTSFNMIRHIMTYIRNKIVTIVGDIFARIFNVVVPVQVILIKLKSILGKSVGSITGMLYTVVTLFLSMKAFLGAFLEIIVIGLVVLAAATIAMWILPFTWPIAATMTALFVAVAVPLGVVATGLGDVLHITTSHNIPNKPGCLDKDTIIELEDGEKKVTELKVGDTLKDGSKITAFMKLATSGREMFDLNGVIISGSHKVLFNSNWIDVAVHPSAQLLEDYEEPYIYCFNTTNKRVTIGKMVFLDWDEIDDYDFLELKLLTKNFIDINASTKNIHSHLEGGFHEDTIIELEDGRAVKIKDLRVFDQLRFGESVLGIVEIDAPNMSNIYNHKIKNHTIIGGSNLWIDDDDLGKFTTLGLKSNVYKGKTPDKLYQILTDSGTLVINGVMFLDYNSAIEEIMGIDWVEQE